MIQKLLVSNDIPDGSTQVALNCFQTIRLTLKWGLAVKCEPSRYHNILCLRLQAAPASLKMSRSASVVWWPVLLIWERASTAGCCIEMLLRSSTWRHKLVMRTVCASNFCYQIVRVSAAAVEELNNSALAAVLPAERTSSGGCLQQPERTAGSSR